jgi:ribose transport system substrate-binding protein
MRKTTKSLLATVFATMVVAASGCGTTSENTGQVQPQDPTKNCKGPQGTFKIGMSQANVAEPYRVRMNEDIEKAAAEVPQFKGKVEFLDAAQDNSKQVNDVENLLTKQVDLLLISPNEAGPLTEVVKQAYNKPIPVVVLDRKVEGEAYTTFIGADNVAIGRQAGEYFKKMLPQGGKIVQIRGLSGSTPAAERDKGFREAIQGTNIQIVAEEDAEWERSVGQEKMDALLKAHPDIVAVYSQNDPMAEGAYLAAQAAGRKDIKFVGIDGLPIESGGIKAVEQGRLQATNLYPTGGKEAVEAAKKILIDCQRVPKQVTLPTELITKDNAAEVYTRLNSQG